MALKIVIQDKGFMQSYDEMINECISAYHEKHSPELHRILCRLIEHLNEEKWINGNYSNLLDPISKQMSLIEKEYGLQDDESFYADEGPTEWKKLSAKYEDILFDQYTDLFVHYNLSEIAEEARLNRISFKQKMEQADIDLKNAETILKSGKRLALTIAKEFLYIKKNGNIKLAAYTLLTQGIELALYLISLRWYLSFLEEFNLKKNNDPNYKKKEHHTLSIGDLFDILNSIPHGPFTNMSSKQKSKIKEYYCGLRNDHHHPARFIKKNISINDQEINHLYQVFEELLGHAGIELMT